MTARALISLAESNKRVAEQRAAAELLRERGMPNRIACPKCAKELHDLGERWSQTITGASTRQQVVCHGCGWRGAREC